MWGAKAVTKRARADGITAADMMLALAHTQQIRKKLKGFCCEVMFAVRRLLSFSLFRIGHYYSLKKLNITSYNNKQNSAFKIMSKTKQQHKQKQRE